MNEQQLLALLQLAQNNPAATNSIIRELQSRQHFQQLQTQTQLSHQLNQQELINSAPWLEDQVCSLDLEIEQAYFQGLSSDGML